MAASALSLLEKAGGVPEAMRISVNPFWKNAVAGVDLSLAKGRLETKKAPVFFLSMVIALQLYIMNKERARFTRALAWIRLVKLWGSLRSDDLQGMLPETMTLYSNHLEVKIQRSECEITPITGTSLTSSASFLRLSLSADAR